MKSKGRQKVLIGLVIVLLLIAAGGLYLFTRTPRAGLNAATAPAGGRLYICGMHPQVVQDHPGNCPICGMKLMPALRQAAPLPTSVANSGGSPRRNVKYYKSTMMLGEISQTPRKDSMGMDMVPVYEDEAVQDTTTISIDPVTIQNMGVRTGLVTKGPLRHTIRTVAVIDYNETTLVDVTTKIKGWIEKLYVNSTGREIHRGEALFEIYSPDLYIAQTEYLSALTSRQADKTSVGIKLKYYDISDEQVSELEKTRQPKKTLRINAPADGVVTEKSVVEGQMVDAGQKLYRIADLSTVWVQAQIYEQDLAFVRLGQEATVSLSYLPDRKFRGQITYIYPMVDEKTRTAQVRMEFHNPGFFLKPGMFATVELHAELAPSALLVPDAALLRSGEKTTVFVALDHGRFEPRTVTLGARSEDHSYEVIDGLKEGERVVTSAEFMLDSESQLREAIAKMLEPARTDVRKPVQLPPAADTGAASPVPVSTATVAYLCPMPEHVAIRYDHPGNCPICGMKLVPVTADLLAHVQPGGRIDHYTCPMPEHADVHSNKPGQCPRCGMTLIPVMKDTPAAAAPPVPMTMPESGNVP